MVRQTSSGKWICKVSEPNKKSRVWLGTYPTAEMTARAHDVAVLAMSGRSACLIFVDSVLRLPLPESSNVSDIKKAAAMAAEVFGQTSENSVEIVETKELQEIVLYVDEEEMFGMSGCLTVWRRDSCYRHLRCWSMVTLWKMWTFVLICLCEIFSFSVFFVPLFIETNHHYW